MARSDRSRHTDMTAKQIVLKEYPDAYCARGVFRFTVWPKDRTSVHTGHHPLGGAWSAVAAWAEAAKKIRRSQSRGQS